ncbi:hypothetical protein IFM89_013725 [Coptis chinensis]|uniref:Ubiquitin-like domain-containing protein n=1 Tax=Coptis chinensis TaxID=261450 RepID=A0A835HSG2_9MAGN|nr:hypothetical protein IFM89_013725 [Coptis chinensis]
MALFSPSKQQGCSHITPGATRSGFRISNVRKLGPLDENAATIGEGRMPNFVPKKARVAVGRGLVRAYCLIIFPAVAPTAIAGTRWLSATSSSPFSAVLANIMPTPPASFTTCPLCTLGLMPLSHITIFPVTTAGSMAPSRHMEVGSGLLELSETPDNVLLLPSFTTDGKSLSIVLAPTVVIHGDTFMRVIGSGPPFPAEQETNTPFSIAPKVATAKLSWLTQKRNLLLIEIELLQLFDASFLQRPDRRVTSPFILAVQVCDEEVVKLLLGTNIDVNETDREGNSACIATSSTAPILRFPDFKSLLSQDDGVAMGGEGKSKDIKYIYGKSEESVAGDWLQNEQMVVDYDIKNGSIISVFLDSGFRTKIHIKMLQIGKPITLDVDMRDTVLTIKCRIQNKEGISVGQQELFYLGEEVDDGRTIASYNIEGGSTIYAVFRLGDTMLISVTTEKNRTFSLKVKRWFTVLNVKFLIVSMLEIPIGKQKLWLDKVELENDMTLADLHFSEGQTLNLRSDSMQIFIRVPLGKLINCRVDGSYTVQNVQEMIEEQEGIHIRS